jgi:hypothetical protein
MPAKTAGFRQNSARIASEREEKRLFGDLSLTKWQLSRNYV